VNLPERHGNDLLVREIDLLRAIVRRVRQSHPFRIDAWVVLPEHLHCVWTLPPGDSAQQPMTPDPWRIFAGASDEPRREVLFPDA
jgi:REP element-mobilizing transposase RayT